jgi:mycoredoxin
MVLGQTSMDEPATPEEITVFATTWCGDCHRAKRVLDRNRARYRWIDVDRDADAAERAVSISGGRRRVPTILFPDGSVLVEPSDGELEAKLTG